MIKINITSPTKCYIENYGQSVGEVALLQKELTYSDTSIVFNLQKLKKNRWLKENKPLTYNQRIKELEEKQSTCMLGFDVEKQKPWFHPGSIPYLQEKNFNFDIQCNINYPEPRKIAWRKVLPFDLYGYQDGSVESLIEIKHGNVELCTGAGKTAIILTLARELGLRTVIVTPSKSIFLEMLKKFEHHFGKSNVGAYGAGKKKIGKRFTVCVSKSLTMIKEGTPEYEFFSTADVLISDESHLNAAETLETTFHGLLKDVPYRFFLSGTQVRGDGKDKLLESIIGKNVYSLSTKEAVEGGYICPVKFLIFETTSKDTKNYNDPLKSKRKQFLYNQNIADIAAKIANSAWNQAEESTLILVEELEQISMLVDRLNVPFGYVHSASKKDAAKFGLETRKVDEAVEAFNRGEVKVLIGTSCIATGTNIYCTHNTVNWVGGSSEVRTKQGAVGRSVRILENSEYKDLHKAKPYSKIYDFKVSNIPLMEKHLQKRIKMYKETTNDIRFVKL
jgi:superfamily II DNA or RNA helicase